MNYFCQHQSFGKLLTRMCSPGSEETEHVAIRIVRIFSVQPMVVGWEHSKSTCSSEDFPPVCILMAVNLKWHPTCLWISHHWEPPVLGFGRRSHKQPTPCPWHRHLLLPLACSQDVKLYPVNQSILWHWWNWAHATISPVEIYYNQLCLLER